MPELTGELLLEYELRLLPDELLLAEVPRETPDDELRDEAPLWDTDPLLRDAVPALETELPAELRVTFLTELAELLAGPEYALDTLDVAGTRLTVDDDVPRAIFEGRAAEPLR